ncbi:carboxypeptidase-like regulatory domain-containing protein [Pedobacter sp. NJ-S-72]
MKKKNLLTVLKMCIAIVLITISMDTFAQRIQFKGIVKDESQAIVPGVSVVIKGSRTGTSTQSDGTFVISAEKGQTVILYLL